MFQNDRHIGRSVMRRVEVVEVDDSGEIQQVTVKGLADEVFRLPLRGQPFGTTGVPPVGSVGYLFMAGGRPDQAFLMGLEHPEHRPADQASGEHKVYAQQGQEMHMDQNGDNHIRTPQGVVYINCD